MPIDSPRDPLEFTDRVLYEPYWIPGHAKDFENDAEAATEALLNAFNMTFCQYREMSRHWVVLHPKSKAAVEQAEKWGKAYCNLRFMTVEDFKAKVIGH